MLQETEPEETIDFLSLVAFQWGGGPPAPPRLRHHTRSFYQWHDSDVTLRAQHTYIGS